MASGTTFTTPAAHNLATGNTLRFTASGGTAYSGLVLTSTYQVLSTPLATTFTCGQIVNGAAGAAVNAGTAGSGTTSVGAVGGSNLTIFSMMSGWYTKYQDVIVNGIIPAPAVVPRVRWYEGALEPSAPTTAQGAAIGISSTDVATLATALVGWKNSALAAATIQFYYQTFIGTAPGTVTTGAMPNSQFPAQLVLHGGGLYALNSNSSYVSPQPYQLFYGFRAFSSVS
jgi:hypothetical protein